MSLKLLVIGHGRHGKDTVCDLLREHYKFTFESSSKFCSKRFIFDKLKDKYNYKTEEECYADRHNHREEWFNLIREFNKDDLARLGKEIFNEYAIYCGLRNREEFEALKKSGIDFSVIWVDRSKVLPLESEESMQLTKEDADYIIDNNSDYDTLVETTHKVIHDYINDEIKKRTEI